MSAKQAPRVTYRKVDAVLSAMATYEVLLDGNVIGKVSKVRDRYLRRVGSSRGSNVPAARTAWAIVGDRFHSKYDSRAEAAVALVTDTQDIMPGTALDIVRGKD